MKSMGDINKQNMSYLVTFVDFLNSKETDYNWPPVMFNILKMAYYSLT